MRPAIIPTILLLFLSLLAMAAGGPGKSGKQKAGIDNLEQQGHSGVNPAHVMDVEILGDRAYVAVGFTNGLETYDISDPANPVRLQAQDLAAWAARAYGNELFTFRRNRGFQTFDISGSRPVAIGGYDPTGNDILYENGVLLGTTLHVAAHQVGIDSFDVSVSGAPVFLNNIVLAENDCWDVEVSGSFLFAANGHHGMSVVDLVTRTEIAVVPLPGLTNHILLDGNVAVLSLGDAGIATVDISSPAAPLLLDTASTAGCAFGSGILDNMVAVGSWTALELFDVSDPANIVKAGWDSTKTWAMGADIAPHANGDLVAVADWRGMTTYLVGPDAAPDIDISSDRLDFGEVSLQEDLSVEVSNTGIQTLTVTVGSIPSGFTVTPGIFSVAPGGSQTVVVSASGTGSVKDSIEYRSNDPDESVKKQFVYKNNTSFPQVDSPAPDFCLKDIDDYWHYLSDYRGSVVFIEFGGLW